MKLAYHGATSMTSDLVTDVKASSQAGFKAMEIWASKIDDFLKTHSLDDLRALFVDNYLEPAAISSIEFIAFRGKDYAKIKNRCKELCQIAQYLDCPTLVVVPSPTPTARSEDVLNLFFPWEKIVQEYVSVLRDLADIAKPYGVRLSFEFLGFSWCSVRTPRGAWEIIQEAGKDNVGINFDACHFYNGGAELKEIRLLDPAKICVVHLNDMEDVPKEAITDGKRLLPGKGIIPLDDIFKQLKSIGYDGLFAVELFREEYWNWDPYKLAKESYKAAVKVLSPYYEIK